MLNVKPNSGRMTGDFVTAVTEIKVWDVILDDAGSTLVPQLISASIITVVDATETSADVWSVTLSDESSTVVPGLPKEGSAVGITSSTEDTDGDDRRWDCTLVDGHLASPNGNLTEPIVGSFVYYLSGSPENAVPAAPTWLTMSAAEYTKWM